MVYSYAIYGYAGYAKHGYVTWICHVCHVGYAKFGYATWLRHIRLRRLRQIWLRHMVTPVTPHGYVKFGYAAYVEFGYTIKGVVY